MKRAFFIVALASSLSACGSAETESAQQETTAGSEQPLVAPGEAQVGDRTTCPVSGDEFVVTESSPSVEHAGRTYRFCCPHCAARFEENPESFVSGGTDDGALEAESPAEEGSTEAAEDSGAL